MELLDFLIDRTLEMNICFEREIALEVDLDRVIMTDFIIKNNPVPIYINKGVINNKLNITSHANYIRYKSIKEIKGLTLSQIKNMSIRDVSVERG